MRARWLTSIETENTQVLLLAREIIRERIHAGLARAKAQGKTLGRKPVSTEEQIRQLHGKGLGKLKIAVSSAEVSAPWCAYSPQPNARIIRRLLLWRAVPDAGRFSSVPADP
jgi:hypothetical protein